MLPYCIYPTLPLTASLPARRTFAFVQQLETEKPNPKQFGKGGALGAHCHGPARLLGADGLRCSPVATTSFCLCNILFKKNPTTSSDF